MAARQFAITRLALDATLPTVPVHPAKPSSPRLCGDREPSLLDQLLTDGNPLGGHLLLGPPMVSHLVALAVPGAEEPVPRDVRVHCDRLRRKYLATAIGHRTGAQS